jgi:hypothetical protein
MVELYNDQKNPSVSFSERQICCLKKSTLQLFKLRVEIRASPHPGSVTTVSRWVRGSLQHGAIQLRIDGVPAAKKTPSVALQGLKTLTEELKLTSVNTEVRCSMCIISAEDCSTRLGPRRRLNIRRA